MGHRASSNLFRLGRQRTWNSQWFAKSEYTYLVSLDYRIRDFIDYIFYNLKWPSSELRIKRFISRNVVLEIVLVFPNERIVQYLDSINFFNMQASVSRVDPYKFNTFVLDFNYVLWNISYNVLNKSVFYLLLSALKKGSQYNKMLGVSIYNRLFHTVPISAKHKIKSTFESQLFYRRIFRRNSLDKLLVRIVSASNNTQHARDGLNLLFKKKRNNIGKYRRYGDRRSLIGKSSFMKKKKNFFSDDSFPVVSSSNSSNLSGAKRSVVRYFSSGHISKLCCGTKNIINNFPQKRFLILDSERIKLRNRRMFSNSLQLDTSDIAELGYVNVFESRKMTEFKYLILNIVSLFTISNDIIKIGRFKKYFYFMKYLRFLHKRFSRRLQGWSRGNAKLTRNSLGFNMLKYYGYRKNVMLSKYYRHYESQLYHPPANYSMLSLHQKNKSRYNSLKWRALKRYEVVDHYNDTMLELYLFVNLLFYRNFNFKNRIFNNIRKRAIFSWLVRNLHTCTQYSYCTIRKSKFVRIVSQLLHNIVNPAFSKKYGSMLKRSTKSKATKNLAVFRSSLRNVSAIEMTFCSEKFLSSYRPLKFFFNFSNMWYFYSSAHWWYKILSFVKDRKVQNHNTFSILYSNFYYLIVSRKFTSYFNFFRFENLVQTPVKFLRYYKKFLLCTNRHFCFFRSARKTLLFMLYLHVYIIKRFVYIQLFLSNFIRCTSALSHGHLEMSSSQQHISTFLFLYHFINHIKFISMTVRVLQLINIFNICDQVVFFFCKVFSILHFINPEKYPDDIKHYFSCFSKYIRIVLQPYNRNKCINFRPRIRDKSHDRDKGLQRIKLLSTDFIIDKKPDIITGRPEFEESYDITYKLFTLNISLLNIFSTYSFNVVTTLSFGFLNNIFFFQFFKVLPGLVKYPYFLLKRGNDTSPIYKNTLLKKKYFRSVPKYLASMQLNNLLSKKHVFFFRFVVDKLLLCFDVLRRDVLPVRSLRSLSLMIEYTLSNYLSNKVLFLPIYYIGKKLPMKQARIVCLYVSYELEKGMPYFLVVKQLGFASNYIGRRVKKRYFRGFQSIFYYGISKLDKRLLSGLSYEFKKYRLDAQSKSVMKYYLFRTFRSISLFRGFTRRIGIRIACSGRVHRRNTRSHTMWFTRGSMPLRVFDKYIDYYSSHAVTHLGTVGIKTWIYLTQFNSLER